jgi:hypothetical protein
VTTGGGLVLVGSGGAIGAVLSLPAAGRSNLDASVDFTSRIFGFAVADALDLRDIAVWAPRPASNSPG